MSTQIQHIGTAFFACALIHTFSCAWIRRKLESRFHYLSEVELVFGIWSVIFMLVLFFWGDLPDFLKQINLTEPVFVMAIMTVSATKTIEQFSAYLLQGSVNTVKKVVPLANHAVLLYFILMVCGPLLGSLITEPAAIAVTAILLRDYFFNHGVSVKFKYHSLALLLLNVSIGGVLTHFAAPPVVMVSRLWEWGTPHMFLNFGWKATVAVLINTLISVFLLKKELVRLPTQSERTVQFKINPKNILLNVSLICLTVMSSHHWYILLLIYLFFSLITKKLNKEPILVGVFLAGLVLLGNVQAWWLEPLISSLNEVQLFTAATLLTSITDNALLTYLGTQVHGLSNELKYFLVAGAVTGGGLTVIANAPNPVAFGILKPSFEQEEISAVDLFKFAAPLTFIAALCFGIL